MNPPTAKSMLKDKVLILHVQDTHEFGKQIRHLVETVDAKKQSKEAFLVNTLERRDYGRIQPFRGDPSHETARG